MLGITHENDKNRLVLKCDNKCKINRQMFDI